MVIFLIPTIVKFAVSLVSDSGVTAAGCVERAIESSKDDLSSCEINYDELGSIDNSENTEN